MPLKARITISTMTYQRTSQVLEFFDRWMYWLDYCPPPRRPVGYGQTSCWYAFEEVMGTLNFHKLDQTWGYPNNAKSEHHIWAGAIHKLRKDDCAQKFDEELKGLK